MVWNSNDYLSSARLCSKAFQMPLLCLVEVFVQFYCPKVILIFDHLNNLFFHFLAKKRDADHHKMHCKKVVLGLFDHLISC